MTSTELSKRKCKACEGGVEPLPLSAANIFLAELSNWSLIDGKMIERKVVCKDFLDAVKLIEQISKIAESEDHHPDLHLTNYKKLTIDLSTHSIGGLSENDFIVAAKIDRVL